jgi:hypothetical protein
MMGKRHVIDFWALMNDESDGMIFEQLRAFGIRVLPCGYENLERALSRRRYDIGVFEFYHLARLIVPAFRSFQPGARVIVDSVDVHFARMAAGVTLGTVDPLEAQGVRSAELSLYRASDGVVVLTDQDRDFLTAEGDMPPLYLLPIIMPCRPRAPGERKCEALFIANYGHPPNVDGLRWFVSEIWPSVHAAVPTAGLTVVGSNATAEVWALGRTPGVEVLGFVPDTNPYLDRAAVSIAPLRYGGGMKGKVSEALGSGVAVVTTSAGAQGFGAVHGKHMLIADEPSNFIQALIGVLRDPKQAEHLGLAGQKLVASLCSPEVVECSLEAMLIEVTSRRRSLLAPGRRWLNAFAYRSLRLLGYQPAYEVEWRSTDYCLSPMPLRRPVAALSRVLLDPRRWSQIADRTPIRLNSSKESLPEAIKVF